MPEIEFVGGYIHEDEPATPTDLDPETVVDQTFVHDDNCQYCGNPHMRKNRPFRDDGIQIECRNCGRELAYYTRVDYLYVRLP